MNRASKREVGRRSKWTFGVSTGGGGLERSTAAGLAALGVLGVSSAGRHRTMGHAGSGNPKLRALGASRQAAAAGRSTAAAAVPPAGKVMKQLGSRCCTVIMWACGQRGQGRRVDKGLLWPRAYSGGGCPAWVMWACRAATSRKQRQRDCAPVSRSRSGGLAVARRRPGVGAVGVCDAWNTQ